MKMRSPFTGAHIHSVSKSIRQIRIAEEVRGILKRHHLVKVSRFVECTKCLNHCLPVRRKGRHRCLQRRTDLNFSDFDFQFSETGKYAPMIFITNSEMANIIAEANVIADSIAGFYFIPPFCFGKMKDAHWKKVGLIPIDKLRSIVDQPIRLWFDIEMQNASGCFPEDNEFIKYLQNIFGRRFEGCLSVDTLAIM